METARVLELGCGDGATSSRWPSGYRGRRSSASTETLRRSLASQELAATLELTNIEFLAADLESFERPALTHVLRDGAAGTDAAHHLAASLARLADHALLVP